MVLVSYILTNYISSTVSPRRLELSFIQIQWSQ